MLFRSAAPSLAVLRSRRCRTLVAAGRQFAVRADRAEQSALSFHPPSPELDCLTRLGARLDTISKVHSTQVAIVKPSTLGVPETHFPQGTCDTDPRLPQPRRNAGSGNERSGCAQLRQSPHEYRRGRDSHTAGKSPGLLGVAAAPILPDRQTRPALQKKWEGLHPTYIFR